MKNITTKQQFHFDNRMGSLTPLTQQVIGYLSDNLPQQAANSGILFKAKFIVTELLTNALKHSATNSVNLDVIMADDYVQIIKIDNGQPLPIIHDEQFQQGVQAVLSQDTMHKLLASRGNNGEVVFMCEEELSETPDISMINEHFGLLIIAKTADEFTYWHDEPVNVFCAKLYLNR